MAHDVFIGAFVGTIVVTIVVLFICHLTGGLSLSHHLHCVLVCLDLLSAKVIIARVVNSIEGNIHAIYCLIQVYMFHMHWLSWKLSVKS